MTKPALSGVRVLDLTQNLPGPLATRMLAELGAWVIKLEDPRGGDAIRAMPPIVSGVSVYHRLLNHNKQSIALDLKTAIGQKTAQKIAQACDVVVEGFRPSVIERLGLGWSTLQTLKSDIILCSISGYGQSGPWRDRVGHDINYLAVTGVLQQTASASAPPVICPAQMADVAGGSYQAVAAILAALFQRERTGVGQWLDVSMAEGVLACMSLSMATAMLGADFAPGQGPLTGGMPCYGIYQTADKKYLAVGALEPHFFENLCNALELPDLKKQGLRLGPQAELVRKAIAERLLQRTRDEWLTELHGLDVCVEPVLEPTQVVGQEHFLARQIFRRSSESSDALDTMASPLRLAGDAPAYHPAPQLGQHSREVLVQAGFSDTQIESLFEQSICIES